MPEPRLPLVLRDVTLEVRPGGAVLMGVLNASPESFSDGAAAGSIDQVLERGRRLLDEGARIIDVGGESGVTNRPPLPADEEIRRVVDVVRELAASGAMVSVDTWKPAVARAVLDAGAHLINDVSGLRHPEIARACAEVGAGLVVMHTRAEPKVKAFPDYDDVVGDVVTFLKERVEVALACGLRPEQLVLDPGPDFAKTPAQTVTVLRHLDEVVALGRPVLLAVSRKDFVGALTDRRPRERQAGTLAAVAAGLDAGASILRVHDVAATADFLRVRAALRGDVDVDPALVLPEALRREPGGG
ncbi:MAG TPA: dihydropteroate synthase [Acidimicrobiia bacterium]|nr:dihydropteroate synthase [Acidimicrobiia bacterium]